MFLIISLIILLTNENCLNDAFLNCLHFTSLQESARRRKLDNSLLDGLQPFLAISAKFLTYITSLNNITITLYVSFLADLCYFLAPIL